MTSIAVGVMWWRAKWKTGSAKSRVGQVWWTQFLAIYVGIPYLDFDLMINASLNWASIVGLLMFLYGLATVPLGVAQIFFVLQRRADTSPAVITKTLILVFQAVGRLIGLPLVGIIMFFQGWRLDPILQFSQFILAFGIIFESAPSIASDYQKWRNRKAWATDWGPRKPAVQWLQQ